MAHVCCDPNRWVLKQSDPVDQEIQTTLEQFQGVLQNWHESILQALGTLGIDLASQGAVEIALEQILDPVRERWSVVLQDAWSRSAEAGRSDAIQTFEWDISWEITDPATNQALQENGQRDAELTQQRMVGDISEAISNAYQEGLGIDEISETLREDVFEDMRSYESRRVARTTGISGANKGRISGFEDAGAAAKTWMARDDNDTRPEHIAADNQTVPLGESFDVGGESAEYPGDPTLSPHLRINCRCLVLPEFDT